MKPEELTDQQKQFLKELIKQEWTIDVPPPLPPEPSPEEKLIKAILQLPDREIMKVKPSVLNPFGNFSAVVVRSKTKGKQVVCYYFYHNLKRLAKLIGREGGIVRLVIENYKAETMKELEQKYPIVSEDLPDVIREDKNV